MKYYYDAALPPATTKEMVEQEVKSRGCQWAHDIPAKDLQFSERIWLLPGQRGSIRYVYDHFVDVATIRAESDIHGEPTKILGDYAQNLKLLFTENLVDQSFAPSAIREYALRALAASTEHFNGEVIDSFKAAAEDSDIAIRRLSLICISRYPAFSLAHVLEEQAAVETDAKLQADQLALAKDIRERGKRGTLW